MRALSLFSGIGGFDIAAEWAGFEIVGMVENNLFCQKVLKKHWPNVKLLGDIHDVKGNEFGSIDIIYGGPPCQPASCAGKRGGTKDDRWLWDETFRIVRVTKPKWTIFENVRGILSLEGGMVFENLLLELESYGYETRTFRIPACAVNAPHRRDRVWIVACNSQDSIGSRDGRRDNGDQARSECPLQTERPDCHATHAPSGEAHPTEPGGFHAEPCGADCYAPNTKNEGFQISGRSGGDEKRLPGFERSRWQESWLEAATRLCRVDDGIPRQVDRVNRLKALGNAIVPQVVYPIMMGILDSERINHARS